MILLIAVLIIYSISYMAVYVLAHQDANMIKPLTTMTAIMLVMLLVTAIFSFAYGYWYIGVIIGIAIIGLFNFLLYLLKY